jgi:hypothetical protein
MLDRQKGEIVFCCDVCGETLEARTSNFDEANNLLKLEGWRAIKRGEEWDHYCDECK